MRIGTPFSQNATKVMLLGAGELGKEVIIALQRLGVEVIAVDRYDHAPGHQVAHRSITMPMTDAAALRKLILKEKPQLVIPEIEAIATDVLAEIEKDHIATVIPTASAVQITMNREGIRRLAAETLRLPTSRYAFAGSEKELREAVKRIGFPCFVKPVMSSSGKGQSRLQDAKQIGPAWRYAADAGRVNQQRVIVEECIEFDYEITLLTVRSHEQGKIATQFCQPIGHVQVDGDYVESWQPQAMSNRARSEARKIAGRVTDSLGGLGIFGVELFIKGDHVWFSEVSPRPHDTGMVTMISQVQSEFELHARAVLGLSVDVKLSAVGASAVIYGGHDAKGIVFDGIDKALSIPGTDLRLFGKPESFVKRRMGVALAHADNVEQARNNAKAAAACIVACPAEKG